MSMEEYLPVRVRTYREKDEEGDATNDCMVLAEITDDDDDGMGELEICFLLKGFRHYIAFRKLDLKNALAPDVAVASDACE